MSCSFFIFLMLRQLTGPLISSVFICRLVAVYFWFFFFLFPLVLSTHRSTAIIQVFAVCWWHDVCIAKHLLLNKNLFGICASFFTHILPCLLTSWVNVKISALFVLCIFFFDSLCAFWIFVFIYLY